MNIDYLRYFVDVANTKSITKAARLNFISPQGMSRAMNELEKEMDCKLLERFPNRLGLTEQCNRILPAVSEVVRAYNDLIEAVKKVNDDSFGTEEESGKLRLLCQPICSFCFFPDEIMDLLLSEGDIRCLEADNKAIISELERLHDKETGRLQGGAIGLTCLFDTQKSSSIRSIRELETIGYSYRPFLISYDMAMVNASSPLAKKDVLRLEDFAGQGIVTSNTELRDAVSRLFGAQSITMTSGNVGLRRQAVARGNSISFMPAISKINWGDESEVVLKPFENRYDLELGFIGAENDFENAAFKALIDVLLAWYRKNYDPSLFDIVWQ